MAGGGVEGNPNGGGGTPVYDWGAAVNGVWKQTFVTVGDYSWNLDGTTVSAAPRLSFPRRSLLEASAAAGGSGAEDAAMADDEGSSAFDVPAFLRRQEG